MFIIVHIDIFNIVYNVLYPLKTSSNIGELCHFDRFCPFSVSCRAMFFQTWSTWSFTNLQMTSKPANDSSVRTLPQSCCPVRSHRLVCFISVDTLWPTLVNFGTDIGNKPFIGRRLWRVSAQVVSYCVYKFLNIISSSSLTFSKFAWQLAW